MESGDLKIKERKRKPSEVPDCTIWFEGCIKTEWQYAFIQIMHHYTLFANDEIEFCSVEKKKMIKRYSVLALTHCHMLLLKSKNYLMLFYLSITSDKSLGNRYWCVVTSKMQQYVFDSCEHLRSLKMTSLFFSSNRTTVSSRTLQEKQWSIGKTSLSNAWTFRKISQYTKFMWLPQPQLAANVIWNSYFCSLTESIAFKISK